MDDEETAGRGLVSREDWPPGPWDDELDLVEFTDEATGLRCVLARGAGTGAWTGYVRLPPGHTWDRLPPEYVPARVHGGVTFAGPAWDDQWWVGFDAMHGGDLYPALAWIEGVVEVMFQDRPDAERRVAELLVAEPRVYRDLAYVRGQCELLARQAASAASPPCG